MSPEYRSWWEETDNNRNLIKDFVSDETKLRRLLGTGLAAYIEDSHVSQVQVLTPELLRKGKKQGSPWHVVHGFGEKRGKRSWHRVIIDYTPDDAPKVTGHPKGYRGKLRSNSKGSGLMSWLKDVRTRR